MRSGSYFWSVLLPGGLLASPAAAQKPVLAWSARLGSNLEAVQGAAVAPDGSVYVVRRTTGTAGGIFARKLSADGSTALCSMTLGAQYGDTLAAMSLVSDGTLLIAANRFLLRVDPCGKKFVYSMNLPQNVYPAALASALRILRRLGATSLRIRFVLWLAEVPLLSTPIYNLTVVSP